MPYVTTPDGIHLYVKDWGRGDPVVLIHGWPLSADTWDDTALALAEAGFRAVAYDRRGFGRSSQPWDGYDYDTLSDDLAAIIHYTGSERVTIVGFSMGGGEVGRYLSRHGGKSVRKAALIASILPYRLKTPDNPHGTEQSAFDNVAQSLREDRAKFFAGLFKDFYGVGMISQTVSEEVIQWSRTISMQASLRATLACQKSFSSTDFRPDLRAFRMPTLIVHGTDDKIVPIDASARAAARGIAGSTLIEYEDAPHGLLASHKDRLSRDLIDFLR